MHKQSRRVSFAALFAGVILLTLNGCDLFGGDEERFDQPYFSYEVYDESGELIRTVTNERVDEKEIETGFGIFGDQLMPPQMIESITERLGLSPEEMRRHQMYLHAEEGISDDVNFITLHFAFSRNEDLSSNSYNVISISKEAWLERLKRTWVLIREFRDQPAGQNPGFSENEIDFPRLEIPEKPVNANLLEHGFGIEQTRFMYQSTGGFMELEAVSDEYLAGHFSIDVAGLPADIMQAEEFPEEPEFAAYRITGNFVAENGDYHDLIQARADFFPTNFPLPFLF